ncbi:MAG: 4-(cytidine 5'-diphospho)-2-C-methyl-D-erythritol kinase [Desulfobacteraceae bacterium]|nr:4-(cytidine 5'-diphospho)-2-C-methyl-D-erythritol kinase [Desulfobacteraceae bacterium]
MLSNSRNKIKKKAYAKINLYLDIKGRRHDGYHILETVMVPVSLADEIDIELSENFSGIKIESSGDFECPCDESNTVFKAASIFLRESKSNTGIKIKIKKNIPVEAGLGGGSSDGACVLTGLNSLFSNLFSIEFLEQKAAEIGADVPFFIKSKPALCTGVGDIISEHLSIDKKYIVLVNPSKGLKTAEVYKNLNWGLTNRVKKNKRLLFKDCLEAKENLINDLEAVAEKMLPEITEIKNKLKLSGAEIAMVSGSGPTCYGLYSDKSARNKGYMHLLDLCPDSWKIYSADFV